MMETGDPQGHQRYKTTNARWPEKLPELTPDEALSAAKRLYRFGMGRAWHGEWCLTSGRRYTWPRHTGRRGLVYFVNPEGHFFGGWRDLVHDVSHYVHRQKHPNDPGHGMRHEIIERDMIDYVVRSGWLEGKLRRPAKPEPTKEERKAKKLAHAQAMLSIARTRTKRAKTNEKKWERRVKRLSRDA